MATYWTHLVGPLWFGLDYYLGSITVYILMETNGTQSGKLCLLIMLREHVVTGTIANLDTRSLLSFTGQSINYNQESIKQLFISNSPVVQLADQQKNLPLAYSLPTSR